MGIFGKEKEKEKEKGKDDTKKDKEEAKKEKEREKEAKKQARKSVKSGLSPVNSPPLSPSLSPPLSSSSSGPKPGGNTGYNRDLDLEESVFKPLVASKQQKEEICFFVLMRMVTSTQPKNNKYVFFEKDSSLPTYILFTTKNLYILDASQMKLIQTIPVTELREVIVEVTENGQVTLELNNNQHVYFLTSFDVFLLNELMENFHRGAKLAQDSRPQPPFFVSQRTTFVQSYIERSHMNQVIVKRIVGEIQDLGFNDQDMWYGTIDLRPWVKKYHALTQHDNTQSFVIEFVLPGGGNKLYFKFLQHVTIKKVIQTVSVGAKMTADKVALAPANGCEMDDDDTLGAYGLGILFDTWQLHVIEKGTRNKYDVIIELPATPEFESYNNKVYKTSFAAHTLGKDAVETVCKAVGVTRAHRFGLTFVSKERNPGDDDDTFGGIVESSHPLSAHGLCGKCTTLRLVYLFFPVASGNKLRDSNLVRSVLLDVITESLIVVKERKKKRMGEYLRTMVKGLADTMVEESHRSKCLTTRVAALNNQSKNALYKMLDEFETEEVSLFGVMGQRRIMERAREFLWTNLPPVPPATAPPKKPPTPPLPPPAPPMLKKGATITRVVEEVDSATGQLTRVKRTVEIGGGFSGPPSMFDLLGARQRLRPVPTRDGGWDKNNANIGMDLRKNLETRNTKASYEIPNEAIELYLKLKKRQEAIEKAMGFSSSKDVEDLGD